LASPKRQRRYIAPHWLLILRLALRYSASRDAFVLRAVGNQRGPVLRIDRRRRPQPFEGSDRRGASVA
jgi:hypothetical protein